MKIVAAAASIFLMLAGAASAAPGDIRYASPGRLVAAEGPRLNLYCMGSGSPAVVFDSGWEDWAPVWAIVQPQVARWTQACSYDRAGAGFSDPGPMPRTSVRIADELHSALRNAGIKGPYVLVGHAFGGDNVRAFAARYGSDTAGLVLVEADVGGLDEHRGNSPLIAGLRDCRNAIAEGRALPPLPAHEGRPPRTCAQQFFRGLPGRCGHQSSTPKLLEIAQTKIAATTASIRSIPRGP